VRELFQRWDLPISVIGQITNDGVARIKDGDESVAQVPIKLLTDPPIYRYSVRKPNWLRQEQKLDLSSLRDLAPDQCPQTFLQLIASPNLASKEWVYRQYDHQVHTNTVIAPGGDAALLRIKGTQKGIALTTDGNGRYVYLDPYVGGIIAVAESARNLICCGAEPLAITDCLNLGNPERADNYYQLKECIRGLARACHFLNIPVISGNVSLYNETQGRAIYPTPVVGMVGLIEDIGQRTTPGFKEAGDEVFLLGDSDSDEGIAGSEYLEVIHHLVCGRPKINLEQEKGVHQYCLSLIRGGIIKSAHDCSDGGLAIALAECCLWGNIGFVGNWEFDGRIDAQLFGEAQSRIIVSLAPENIPQLTHLAQKYQVLLKRLGQVGGERLIIHELLDLPLKAIKDAWQNGLSARLSGITD
jgi:phosphoribosylformylglycinamidine synthase